MEIRLAGVDDVPDLVRLNAHVQDLHATERPYLFHPAERMPGIEAYFEGLCVRPGHALFLAEMDGKGVGLVHAEAQRRPENPFTTGVARAYVHQISVDPAHRRQGIGRGLMARVEEWAREQGLDSVGLDSWSFNTEAQSFFERLGYAPYNVRLSKLV